MDFIKRKRMPIESFTHQFEEITYLSDDLQVKALMMTPHPDVIIGYRKPLKQVFSSVDYNLRKRKGQKKGRLFNWVCFRVFELTLCPSFLLHAYICEL